MAETTLPPYAEWRPADLGPQFDSLWLYRENRAKKVIAFIETYCRLPEGLKQNQLFKLLPWQKDGIVKPLFGTVQWSDEQQRYIRQYTTAWIELGRKNGKSTFAAALALYMTGFDGEQGAQVYGVAGTREQAGIIFRAAKSMVESNQKLRDAFDVIDSKKRIIHKATNSFYQVLSSEADNALGTNPSCVIFDEIVVQKDRELWDNLETGMGARSQPLFIAITTAGPTTAKFCLEEHRTSEAVLEDPTRDPSRFVFMLNTPKDADWDNEENWYHANPSLGHANSMEYLRRMAQSAKISPQKQNAFRMYHLNQWTEQETRWIDMTEWRTSGEVGGSVFEHGLLGRKCYGGLDLSAKQDLTSFVLLFPGSPTDPEAKGFTVLVKTWLPEDALSKRAPMKASLEQWRDEEYLTVFPGKYIDFDSVEQHIMDAASKFEILSIGVDPWQASQVVYHLRENGLEVEEIPQYAARVDEATREIENLVIDHKLYHGLNPVLAWNMQNVQIKKDNADKIKIDKVKSADKIDAVAALVNAMYMALLPEDGPSKLTTVIAWR